MITTIKIYLHSNLLNRFLNKINPENELFYFLEITENAPTQF